MRYSYSNISTFLQCPYRWFLQYKEGLKTLPETNADNALWLGLGLHKGIECGVEAGIAEYKSHYPILTTENINWMIQLEYQIPRVKELLPENGEHEVKIKTENFIGFIDYVHGDTLYDFKFSNNTDRYLESPQLSIYKHYLELVRPDIKINHLKYVFVPKIGIRQKTRSKPPETIAQFRERLQDELEKSEIRIIEVPFFENSINHFLDICQSIEDGPNIQKNQSKLCDWCSYKEYCESDGEVDYNIL